MKTRTNTTASTGMIVSNILQALSGTVNNICPGQMLGVGAMAAVFVAFDAGHANGLLPACLAQKTNPQTAMSRLTVD
ncbi:hypothetical protein [Rhodoferax sp.]|uniref:hypothetical protein n=1 Tax=Rhodoferax sp. TaxID=50421 RepID=UPI00271E025B|nr:hypothetical protein [Rhodoferax sp.]MDO9198214.1 hypothetical protein [Rhodoferax sp.]